MHKPNRLDASVLLKWNLKLGWYLGNFIWILSNLFLKPLMLQVTSINGLCCS